MNTPLSTDMNVVLLTHLNMLLCVAMLDHVRRPKLLTMEMMSTMAMVMVDAMARTHRAPSPPRPSWRASCKC